MHKRGVCRHAVSVCLCVCLSVCLSVTFVNSVKTNKHIFIFLTIGYIATPFLFLRTYQTLWQYSDGTPLMGTSNAGVVSRNCDSEHIGNTEIFYFIIVQPTLEPEIRIYV